MLTRVKWPGTWAWQHLDFNGGFFLRPGTLIIILTTANTTAVGLMSFGIFTIFKRDVEAVE